MSPAEGGPAQKGRIHTVAAAPATDPDRSMTPGKGGKALLGVIAFALTVGLGWLVSSLQPDTTDPAIPTAPQSMSTNTVQVPGDQVGRVHAALHDIGARCGPTAANPSARQQLAADAEVIVSFAERYPEALFTVDDEAGRTLSLLLVARDELRICAPAASRRADLALPPQFRAPSSQPGTPPS